MSDGEILLLLIVITTFCVLWGMDGTDKERRERDNKMWK
jgi:hypothetical protein